MKSLYSYGFEGNVQEEVDEDDIIDIVINEELNDDKYDIIDILINEELDEENAEESCEVIEIEDWCMVIEMEHWLTLY